MTTELQLAEHALGSELALELLDGALDAAVTDDDFEGLALHGFGRHRDEISCSF
jgi:hypothetical protein